MTLKQAVWIIMGANIGTTITGQLIALDIGAIAPETCVIYSEILINLERVPDHLQNIAEDCSHAHLTLNTYNA